VLEQILGVLLRIVKDFKLQHQHQYVTFFYLFTDCHLASIILEQLWFVSRTDLGSRGFVKDAKQ
jgi:hypothetical protein